MTPRPPHDEQEALDAEERAFAARLAAAPPPGPSAALDARILAAARAATAAPPPASRRPTRRWPTAVGAAATLVIAVGLAWQLKPLLEMPAPLRQAPAGAPMEVEVLAEARPVMATPPPAAPPVADAAPPASTARIADPQPRRAASVAPAEKLVTAQQQGASAAADEFVDEAVGDHAQEPAVAAVAAPAPPPPPAPEAAARLADPMADAQRRLQTREAAAADVAEAFGPVSIDASLPPADWLERIRARRDAGDTDGARDSLRRFMREHPRLRVPADLRPLRAARP